LLHPIPYGIPKVNSGGGGAQVRYEGFPSLKDGYFRVGVDFSMPNQWCFVFQSLQPTDLPFAGGRLYVMPPYKRYPRFKSDFLGYGARQIPIEPWMVGQTLYFQVYYEDPEDPVFGGSLS